MNNRNIGLGVFLLSIGILWVLINLGLLSWSVFTSIFTLWPLLLVLVGINIIFRNNQIVKAIGWVAFLAILIIYGYFTRDGGTGLMSRDGGTAPILREGNNISIEKPAETRKGELRLDLGGLRFNINSGTANLVDAVVTDPYTKHSIDYKNGKETAELRFKRDNVTAISRSMFEQDCNLKLNKDMEWDIKLNVGAVNGTVDMRELQVKKLDVDTGAGNLKLMFGSSNESTQVDIDAGASKIDVFVPDIAGVRVKLDGGLNKTNLSSLEWKKQGNYYESPNYSQAKNKIDLDVDMGVGNFNVILEK